MIKKEPTYFDMVYEEMKQCEGYALLNMFTFEAAIRNPGAKKLLSLIDNASADTTLDAFIDGDNTYINAKQTLKEKYLLDYDKYKQYKIQRYPYIRDYNYLLNIHRKLKEDINIGLNKRKSADVVLSRMRELMQHHKKSHTYNLHLHQNESHYIHYANLPFYRPMMSIQEKDSIIKIEIPLFQIHKSDFESYFKELQKNLKNTLVDINAYHELSSSFYNLIEKKKNKAETIAMMFFTWDYVQYFESSNSYTPDYLKVNLCADITKMISGNVNEKTARNKAEDYLLDMKKLIEGAEYKKYYTTLSEVRTQKEQ